MKLKRLLCALVVFTLMMTSVVCSVSADPATYQTATKYDLGTGAVYLETTVNGLTGGSMVSYIIYDNAAGTGVADNGSNIEYIDQQTASSNGTLVFGSDAKFERDDISGMAYTFASSGSEHEGASYEPIMKTDIKGAQTDVTGTANTDEIPVDDSVTYRNYFISFEGKGKDKNTGATRYPGVESVYMDYTGYYYDNADKVVEELGDFRKQMVKDTDRAHTKDMYVEPSSVVIFDIVTEPGKKVTGFNIQENAIFNGASHQVQNSTTNFAGRIVADKLKFDLSEEMNGDFFNVGAQYTIYNMTTADVTSAEAKYIKIDGNPIYADEGDNKGVTFLMTKSDLIANTDNFGVNVYAYPVGSDEAEAVFGDLQAFNVSSNKFGIQLVIDANADNAKFFDDTQYKLVAVPYCDGAELATTGSNLFYTTTDADLSGSYNN